MTILSIAEFIFFSMGCGCLVTALIYFQKGIYLMARKSKKSIVLFVDPQTGEAVDISQATDIRVYMSNGAYLARVGTPGNGLTKRLANGVAPENLPELLKPHGFKLRGMTNEGRPTVAHNYKFSK